MSLFTDSDHILQADLLAVDPEVTEIVSTEGITVEGATGIVRQVWSEASNRVLDFTQRFGPSTLGDHDDALSWSGGNRSRIFLTQVIVSNRYGAMDSPFRRWLLYRCLEFFYQSAMRRRITDRYEFKRDNARDKRMDAWRHLVATGLPVVSQPLIAPGSVHELNTGVWSASNLSDVAGGATAETNYDVAITWTDSDKYVSATEKGNGESGPSETLTFTVPLNRLLKVDITSLTPPGSVVDQRGSADGSLSELTATHWNVYVGAEDGILYRQNATPTAIATTDYTLAAAPVLSGDELSAGQHADRNQTMQAMVMRG